VSPPFDPGSFGTIFGLLLHSLKETDLLSFYSSSAMTFISRSIAIVLIPCLIMSQAGSSRSSGLVYSGDVLPASDYASPYEAEALNVRLTNFPRSPFNRTAAVRIAKIARQSMLFADQALESKPLSMGLKDSLAKILTRFAPELNPLMNSLPAWLAYAAVVLGGVGTFGMVLAPEPPLRRIVRWDEVDYSRLTKPILVAVNVDAVKDGKIKDNDATKVEEAIAELNHIETPLVFVSHNGRPRWREDGELEPGDKGNLSLLPIKEYIEKR
jgi:hypothetical protein